MCLCNLAAGLTAQQHARPGAVQWRTFNLISDSPGNEMQWSLLNIKAFNVRLVTLSSSFFCHIFSPTDVTLFIVERTFKGNYIQTTPT
jgi:hypothetical protein